jgi:hypothetical protein
MEPIVSLMKSVISTSDLFNRGSRVQGYLIGFMIVECFCNTEHTTAISVSSSFPIRNSMLDVRCSMFDVNLFLAPCPFAPHLRESACTGSIRAARRAGRTLNVRPVAMATPSAAAIDHQGVPTGKAG